MVFPVSQSKLIDRKSVVIVGSPRVLLFDEVPILFTGKTEFGSHVIGSSVIDDRENDFERYFHILVTNKDFRDFHAGNVSYLELLKNAHPIYVIDRATDSEIISYIEFQAIPDQFRPTVHTYFPESARDQTIAAQYWNTRTATAREARLVEALESTANASRQTLDIIKRERFVFDDLTDRWQKLAFTIYTELTQASTDAKNALAEHRGEKANTEEKHDDG